MKSKQYFLALAGVFFLCGCDQQTKRNTEKIAVLSERLAVVQQSQSAQLSLIQTQLTSLAPMLDRVNSYYFEKSHDNAIFFHTNNLYLMLTVGKQIQSQLQLADAARQAERDLTYGYHTNQLRALYLCTLQLEEALVAQESRLTNQFNAETRRVSAALGEALFKQIQMSLPDEAEVARQQDLALDVARLQRDLEQIKLRLGITNPPTN